MEETNFNDFYKDLILLSRILLNVNAVDVFNLLICHEKAENRVQTALTHHFKNALKTQNIPMSADLKLIKSVFPSVSIDQISTDLFQQTSGNAASRVELVLKKYLRDENTDSLSVGLKRNYLCCDNLNDSTSKKIKSNYIDFESVEGMIKLDVFDRPSNTLNVNTNASSIEEYISGKETNSSLDIAENLCNVDECIIISDDNISNNNESLNLDFDNINKNSERLAATNLNDEFCVTKSYTENVADIINLMPKSRVKFEDENISDIETSFVYTLKGSILKNPPKTFNDILQIERDKLLQVPTDYRLCKSANKSHDKLNVSKYYLDTCKSILPIVSVDNNTNPTNSSLIVPGYRSNLLSTSEKQTAVNNSAEMSKTPVCEDHKHMLRVRKSSATDGVSNSTDMLKTRLYENQKNGLRRKKFPAITVNNSALMPKPRLCQNQKLTQISATIVSNNSELMPKTHLCQDQKFKRITAIVASNNSVVMPKSRLCQNQKLKEIPATVESNNSAVMSKARSCENQKLKQIPATIASNNPVEIHNMRVCENQSRTLAYNSLAIPNIDVCENQNHVLKQKQIPATIVRPVESDTDDDKPLNKRLTNFNTIINGFIGEHRGNASTSSSSEFMVHDDEDLSVASADYEDKWVKATVVHPYNLQTATVGLPHNLQTATARPAHNLETSSTYTTSSGFHEYYFKILEMFPDICPTYLKQFLSTTLSTSLDEIITALLDGTYKKRDTVPQLAEEENFDFENQYATLLELFPDADPTFLQNNCEQLIAHPEAYKAFVADLIENRTYPSKEDYLKKMNLSAQERQYTTEFDVKHFLQLIPDPIKHFSNRTPATLELEDSQYALTFLKNHYGFLTIREINNIFKQCNYDMIYAAGALTLLPKTLKSKRKPYPLPSCKNIPLLQELAYIKHNKEILDYIKDKEISDKESKVEAKEAGTLKTCQCCFDDEIMPADTIFCDNGHLFCKDCVRKGCEVKIGEGKLNFPCLEDCDQQFSLQILKSVLTPKVFSKMAQRKQLEEVKAAGIEDLEFCPFCDFATIPALGDKLFRCMNNDCMKESCRECKEPSHIPLRCDEVEREQDVKQRIYIENKMTDALLRKCYNCGMKFIKESGCNKMTCSCGAIMCYVCKQPVKDYRHFNGQGGDKHHLCPLYSDINELHLMAIKRSAEDAKKELGLNTNAELKIDPAQDIDQHYKKKPKQQTVQMNELHRNLVHLQHQLHYHRHRHHVVHAHRHRHHRHE